MGYSNKRMNSTSKFKYDLHVSEQNKEKYFHEKKERMEKSGSNIRVRLHEYIVKALEKGESKEDILNYLQSEEEFKSLSEYFETYIDDHIKKIEREKQGKAYTRPDWDR